MELRPLCNTAKQLRLSRFPQRLRRFPSSVFYSSSKQLNQVNPIGAYYESILSQPLPDVISSAHPPTISSPPESTPKTDKEEIIAKARVVFGSRLGGPAERRSEIESKSTLIAGIMVPPKPEEPDNCCMSGCVNCVWDRYGDEVEEWAAAKKTADTILKERSLNKDNGGPKVDVVTALEGGDLPKPVAASLDDDGVGSETSWGTGLETDLFGDIPVGIREFMKQEKRLKEKHAREGTSGG